MTQPAPETETTPRGEELTRKGEPRKRAVGGGRKPSGRVKTLGRVSDAAHEAFEAYAARHGISKTEAIEAAARLLMGL